MTPRRKTNDSTHNLQPRPSFDECGHVAMGGQSLQLKSLHDSDSNSALFHHETARAHCAASLQVRSKSSVSVALRRGVSCGANQQHDAGSRPVPNGEQVFPAVHHKVATPSRLQSAPFGRARRQPSSHSVLASRSVPPNSGSPVIVSHRSTRSWSCSTNCGPASGPEDHQREETANARNDAARQDYRLSRRGDRPLPLSQRLQPGTAGAEGRREGLSHRAALVRCAAAGTSRLRRSHAGQRRDAGLQQARAEALIEYPRGVRYTSQGSLRKGRKHLGADDRSLAALSARLVFSAGRVG